MISNCAAPTPQEITRRTDRDAWNEARNDVCNSSAMFKEGLTVPMTLWSSDSEKKKKKEKKKQSRTDQDQCRINNDVWVLTAGARNLMVDVNLSYDTTDPELLLTSQLGASA